MKFNYQIEYIGNLVENPENYYMNPILRYISYPHFDSHCLYFSLYAVEPLKTHVDYYSEEYLFLTHHECVARQKIQETANSLPKSLFHLFKAYACSREIQEIYPKLKVNCPITDFVGMQAEATILTKLSEIEESTVNLHKALQLFETVKDKTKDVELKHLAMRNEANLRLKFAINKINPLENCIKSIKLSENSRNYYGEDHIWYESLFQNQLNATLELEINESFGFVIENKKRIEKLLKKINAFESVDSIKLRLKLIDLGVTPISDLDKIYSEIKEMRKKFPPFSVNYQKTLILEGETLIKKAEHIKTIETKVNLAKTINLFKKYRVKEYFNDPYYETITYYKEAYARLLLFKINNDEELLNTTLKLLNNAKRFYEKTPLQNQIIHYPLVLYYLALTKKEIFLKNNSLRKNHPQIENLLIEAITYFKKRNNYEKIVESYFELGNLFYNLEKFEESYNYLNDGIELIETMRDSIIDLNLKETFFNKVTEFYKLMINIYCHLNKPKQTLKYVELTKQRLFLDKIIINQRENLIGSATPNLIKKLNAIEKEIIKINNELNNFDKNNFIYSELYEKLLNAKKEQYNIISKIKKEDPPYYDNYFNNIHDYSKINLDNKTIIEYYYNKNSLLIFLINKTNVIMKKINFNNKEHLFHRLKTIILDTRNDGENLKEFNEILSEFYDILIKPIKKYIKNEKRLLIIPYGQLHNVPFNGLYSDEYLIEDYEITIVQSASLVKYLKNNYTEGKDDCLVIGNPTGDLVNSEKEANTISKKLNTKPVIFKDANKENILNLMENKKIIHYTGHGNFNIDHPLESSLELFDEDLYLKDLEDKNINSELIVLSSCETGLVSVSGLDENKGLVNYLQISGAKYIIAPLWAVIDEPTLELFEHFYSKDQDYTINLRNSQLALKDKYDIYKWGAFQIYGI